MLRDADSVAAPPPPVAPGLGDGSATESRVARWLAGVADAVARWTAEERLAMEIFGENLDGGVAREVVPPILEHAARRALAPVEAFAARVSGDGNRRESREMAFVGRGRAAHARDGDRDAAASDADARHRDLTNTRARGCPEKVFALVRARDALTRARWGAWRRPFARTAGASRMATRDGEGDDGRAPSRRGDDGDDEARGGAGGCGVGTSGSERARTRGGGVGGTRAERGGAPRARRRAPRREDVALRRRRRGDERRGGRDGGGGDGGGGDGGDSFPGSRLARR